MVDGVVDGRELAERPERPIVATMPVIASSSGIPAATIAPNAIGRTTSVIGSS